MAVPTPEEILVRRIFIKLGVHLVFPSTYIGGDNEQNQRRQF